MEKSGGGGGGEGRSTNLGRVGECHRVMSWSIFLATQFSSDHV